MSAMQLAMITFIPSNNGSNIMIEALKIIWDWCRSFQLTCRHQWIEKVRAYSPPLNGFSVSGLRESSVKQMLLGVTTIEYQCKCGKHYTAVLLGQVPSSNG